MKTFHFHGMKLQLSPRNMSALCSYLYNCHHLFNFFPFDRHSYLLFLCVRVWIPLCSWHIVMTRLKHVLKILSSTTLEFWTIRKITMEIHLQRWWQSHWNTSIYFSIYSVLYYLVTSYISFPREYLYFNCTRGLTVVSS